LVVLLPHLNVDRMSGGPNTVFQITARLLQAGIKLRYAATTGPLAPHPDALRDHIQRITGIEAPPEAVQFVDVSARGAVLDLGSDDVLMATWWRTAHMAKACLGVVRAPEFIYLVQDFEPGFYPWSTKSALAEATYNLPIRALVNEPLLERYLRQVSTGRFESADFSAQTFMPAVDRAVFARRDRSPGTPRRLVFYARPRNPRNLFEIGLRVLRDAAAAGVFDGGSWEFLAIGQELPDLPLSSRHVLKAQPWLRYEEYGALLGSSDVLLSLMLSPHTSYPPLEMAAAGGLVVTNTYGPKTSAALAEISPAIRAAAPEVEPLVAALREAVAEASTPRSSPVALAATWDEALREALPWLAQQVLELRAA
jgi:beta-1,2-rhamnosyltransferase WsaF-like protein